MSKPLNVDQVLSELTLEEKVKLLSGRDTWSTYAVERLNIPSLTVRSCELNLTPEFCADLIRADNRWTTWRPRHVLFQWRESALIRRLEILCSITYLA